jgi:hypothetical protein
MTEFETLTNCGGWGATPEDYNAMNILKFSKDGSARLVLGYGQAVFADVSYRFEITSPGVLRLICVNSSSTHFRHGQLGRRIVEAERNSPRELPYTLTSGEFRGEMNMGSENGPFTYHFGWRLALERPPYPEATVLPFGQVPTIGVCRYYGYPAVG